MALIPSLLPIEIETSDGACASATLKTPPGKGCPPDTLTVFVPTVTYPTAPAGSGSPFKVKVIELLPLPPKEATLRPVKSPLNLL